MGPNDEEECGEGGRVGMVDSHGKGCSALRTRAGDGWVEPELLLVVSATPDGAVPGSCCGRGEEAEEDPSNINCCCSCCWGRSQPAVLPQLSIPCII